MENKLYKIKHKFEIYVSDWITNEHYYIDNDDVFVYLEDVERELKGYQYNILYSFKLNKKIGFIDKYFQNNFIEV